MNSQSLPRFSRTNSLKQRKIGAKIWHDNLAYIPLAWWIVRTNPVFLEFIEIKIADRLKIGYGNLKCIPLTEWVLRIYPALENQGVLVSYRFVYILFRGLSKITLIVPFLMFDINFGYLYPAMISFIDKILLINRIHCMCWNK